MEDRQMPTSALVVLMLAVVSATSAWAGHAIKHQRRYDLIAGYDASKLPNPDALGRWVGNGAFAMAAMSAAGIIAVLLVPDAWWLVALTATSLALGAAALVIAAGGIGRGR
jgi:hypothetical protein